MRNRRQTMKIKIYEIQSYQLKKRVKLLIDLYRAKDEGCTHVQLNNEVLTIDQVINDIAETMTVNEYLQTTEMNKSEWWDAT